MSNINWFPGHMTKATRMIEDNIKVVDAVIYVLDARCPLACINEHFNSLIGSRPIVFALNKADLAPSAEVSAWISALTTSNSSAIALDSTKSNSANKIIPKLTKLLEGKIERLKNRGVSYTIKAMVLGVPNTGKSTLINNLCGKARAMAGNKPGVTKGKQWLKVNNYLELLDTPGVLKPKLDDQRLAYHLAYCGSVKDDVLDIVYLATRLITELSEEYSSQLTSRYNNARTLEEIGRLRGYLIRGGEVDLERTAIAVVDDFRKGRIGNIILEKANEIATK